MAGMVGFRFRGLLLVLAAALVSGLTGCGGGAETIALPVTGNDVTVANYNGPPPATADVQSFKLNLWDNLMAANRCGACHVQGVQSPAFVRNDDINLAYSEANPLVDLSSPADSRLVAKVGGGHNCWLDSNLACAAIITAYIEAWAGGSVSAAGRKIELKPPVSRLPGASKNFPAGFSDFEATVYPLLTDNCARCHAEASATPQSPFFADADVDVAYEAAKAKMNLDDPELSRFVVRLREESHNCWSGDCDADAQRLQDAIQAFADGIDPTRVADCLVYSDALKLTEGTVASGGNRHEANVIALWEFKTGQGTIAYDTSGVEPALNLNLVGNVTWVGGWGIEIIDGKAQGSTTASRKLHDLIKATGEYSVEAWVVPGNVTQEDAYIISYSGGTQARNFTLGQTQYNYDFLHRSSTTGPNGSPALSTADADEDLQATLQHVVVTYDPVNGRRIYVNGVFTDDLDPAAGGDINDWDDSFAFVLGNEVSGDRLWKGKLRLVAIHNRALTPAQIRQNFEVGVGEKFFLLFGVGQHTGVPDSYMVLEASQFDSYSYLFNKPFFVSLTDDSPAGIDVRGMRIAINGREAPVGQVWANLDITVGGPGYSPPGQLMSPLGTVIALEKGPDADEFFLTFDRIGSASGSCPPPADPPPPAAPADLGPFSDIGLRTFDEINATMAVLTGVDPQVVRPSFDVMRQQLPTVETLQGFLSAHQMAVSQLALAYCDALVEDTGLRSSFFGAFDFDAAVADAFGSGDSAGKNQIVNALFDRMVGLPGTGAPLSDAPGRAELKQELIGYDAGGTLVNTENLFDRMAGACSGASDPACQASRTREIVKAMCGATLGSAAMLIQ